MSSEYKACPCCNSNKLASIFVGSFVSVKQYMKKNYAIPESALSVLPAYEALKCAVCGHIFQRYLPSEHMISALYSEWISPKKSLKNLHKNQKKLEQFAKFRLARLIKNVGRGKSLLDYGAGWGTWCFAARECGFSPVAFDVSQEKLKYLEANDIPGVTTLEGKVFDVIILNQVAEHLGGLQGELCTLVKHLNHNGFMFISIPNGTLDKFKLSMKIFKVGKNSLAPYEHLHLFSKRSILSLFGNYGLLPIPFVLGFKLLGLKVAIGWFFGISNQWIFCRSSLT